MSEQLPIQPNEPLLKSDTSSDKVIHQAEQKQQPVADDSSEQLEHVRDRLAGLAHIGEITPITKPHEMAQETIKINKEPIKEPEISVEIGRVDEDVEVEANQRKYREAVIRLENVREALYEAYTELATGKTSSVNLEKLQQQYRKAQDEAGLQWCVAHQDIINVTARLNKSDLIIASGDPRDWVADIESKMADNPYFNSRPMLLAAITHAEQLAGNIDKQDGNVLLRFSQGLKQAIGEIEHGEVSTYGDLINKRKSELKTRDGHTIPFDIQNKGRVGDDWLVTRVYGGSIFYYHPHDQSQAIVSSRASLTFSKP